MSEWYDCADPEQRTKGIGAAGEALRRSDLVVLPTDTVYGVGADAFSPGAVAALLRSKGRGRDMPVPVLVGSWRTLDGLVFGVPDVVLSMVEAFWPGGLTIIVRHAPSLAWDLGDSRGTVAVRMPAHPVALELLTETGPMAVSSANRTGQPPAVTVVQAREQLADGVAVYLDGGPCADPVPSTIVDATGDRVTVRRVGALPVARLREVVPDLLADGVE
ncbi:MAG TPA: L-threonylcarbamoyladenylate synthase [Mycobacteriales bacterium]|jgi:Sua5/YciO/YrdC/YwlC family protein